MQTPALFVASTAANLGARLRLADAVRAGRCPPQVESSTGVVSVAVSDDRSAAELGAQSADRAMDLAGSTCPPIRLSVHAGVGYQGHDLWATASYVQRCAAPEANAPAYEIRQQSNGGLGAVHLAAWALHADAEPGAALISTADTFGPPSFDRFASDTGTVYGDAGTAAVLTKGGGWGQILSVATASAPQLEGMHRGHDPFARVPFTHRSPMDLTKLQREFVADFGLAGVLSAVVAGTQESLDRALKDAGVCREDIAWWVLPNLGRRRLEAGYLRPWELEPERTTWPWGRTVGHLGAGDQLAGLNHLAVEGRLRPGQLCVLAGVGAGFGWTTAVVRITADPIRAAET
ncbi:3-oxoacyl-ACP synthase [Flexivirga sp. ID2601S]|uniref:3-oxoacyl-ACP synthase n=1 Tax=Flexivirga aerilata TaxID=1656889 RepID=A0A849AEE0_9MICO|nr:ketoacyl-ACP synthase III family protein [Flexivirga aerilata]NNG38277.1 3-oxoacyl-ACP synthase [Flexivirga aerilata]